MRTYTEKSAFSLIELVVLITIVGLAIPPLVSVLGQTLRDSSQSHLQTQALALAKGMMEEILSKAFEDPQLASGSFGTEEVGRINYDDVDDYNGYSQSPPTDCRGNTFSAYAPFRVQVSVQNVTGEAPGGAPAANGSTGYKRVTVTVTWNNGQGQTSVVGLAASRTDVNRPPVILTYLTRLSDSGGNDLRFRIRNDSERGVYLTNVIATWSSPTAYYEQITVNAVGYINYGTLWNYAYTNYVRMESGGNAMFNTGDVAYIPSGTIAEIVLLNFKSHRTSPWAPDRNIEHTPFTIEIWAGPDHCTPFVVPAL